MFDPGGVPVFESVFESTAERQPLRPVVSAAALGAATGTEAVDGRRGLLPVLPALGAVLPEGGLRRGTAVSVGAGDTGLLLALAAGARGSDGGWAAAVGLPDLGLAAAAGYGLDLRRLLVADDPGPHWAEVVSVLAGAVELIMLRPDGPVAPKAGRPAGGRAAAQWLRAAGGRAVAGGGTAAGGALRPLVRAG